MKSVKQRFARACHREGIVAADQVVWERRYFDFNVFTERKRVEKLRYIHRNPIRRGLVERSEDWKWSSFRFYLEGESYIVRMSQRYLKCGVSSP
jgi:REP element-mobilizing transposase RayT